LQAAVHFLALFFDAVVELLDFFWKLAKVGNNEIKNFLRAGGFGKECIFFNADWTDFADGRRFFLGKIIKSRCAPQADSDSLHMVFKVIQRFFGNTFHHAEKLNLGQKYSLIDFFQRYAFHGLNFNESC